MTQTESLGPKAASKDRKLGKYAALAGVSLAFPLAAHATIITYTGPPITETATGSTDGTDTIFGITFDASNTNDDVTVSGSGFAGYIGPTALAPGTTIGPGDTFSTSSGILTAKAGPCFCYIGDWSDGDTHYLGVKFDVSGTPEYGWVQLSAAAPFIPLEDSSTFTIDAYAYNNSGGSITIPGSAVPEPSSLALSALGAIGLAVLRARRKRSS
jgi:hypothetical protein